MSLFCLGRFYSGRRLVLTRSYPATALNFEEITADDRFSSNDLVDSPVCNKSEAMNVNDFRRIALDLEGAEESSHMGQPDFRVGGRIFATLASAEQGYGNLKLTPEQQAAFVGELPEVFVPIKGGWGRMGMTHIRLAAAHEDVLAGALRTAWKLRVEKNAGQKKNAPAKRKHVSKKGRSSGTP